MTHRWPRVIGAALTIVVGVWAGVRIYSNRQAAPVHSAPAPSEFVSSVAEAMPLGVKIPDRLPEFSLQGRDGKPVSIKAWAGKSLVINFWATWCAPCRREIPLLQSLQRTWADRGVEVIGIAVDHRDQVLAYADDLKIGYPLLIGEQDALDAAAAFGFAAPAFPFTVFTDRRGEVVALYMGELHQAEADLILSVLEQVNQDQVALPDARRAIELGLKRLTNNPVKGFPATFAAEACQFQSISG